MKLIVTLNLNPEMPEEDKRKVINDLRYLMLDRNVPLHSIVEVDNRDSIELCGDWSFLHGQKWNKITCIMPLNKRGFHGGNHKDNNGNQWAQT